MTAGIVIDRIPGKKLKNISMSDSPSSLHRAPFAILTAYDYQQQIQLPSGLLWRFLRLLLRNLCCSDLIVLLNDSQSSEKKFISARGCIFRSMKISLGGEWYSSQWSRVLCWMHSIHFSPQWCLMWSLQLWSFIPICGVSVLLGSDRHIHRVGHSMSGFISHPSRGWDLTWIMVPHCCWIFWKYSDTSETPQ